MSKLSLGGRRVIEELPDDGELMEDMWFVRTDPDCFGFPLGSRYLRSSFCDSVVIISNRRICCPNLEMVDSSCGPSGNFQIYIYILYTPRT